MTYSDKIFSDNISSNKEPDYSDLGRPGNAEADARWKGAAISLNGISHQQTAWRSSLYEKHGIILGPAADPRMLKVFNPSAIVETDAISGKEMVVLYPRLEDGTGKHQWYGTSRVGRTVSYDGVNFGPIEIVLEPVEPWEKPGGVEDPRVTPLKHSFNGKDYNYLITYTAYDGQIARLAMADSADGINWENRRLVFDDNYLTGLNLNKDFDPRWTKAGAVVPELINSEYYMYFGEGTVWLARSNDLKNWTVDPGPVLPTRSGYFDQDLAEAGPAPEILPPSADFPDGGILLVYNGDARPLGYSTGEAVFDLNSPGKLLYRSDIPVLIPSETYECSGQVDKVIFTEGMVSFNGKRYLYYGAADDHIAVATADL